MDLAELTSKADSAVEAGGDFTKKVKFDSEGAMDPTMAFMQGKLKVEGDMSVAMQLQNLMKKFS